MQWKTGFLVVSFMLLASLPMAAESEGSVEEDPSRSAESWTVLSYMNGEDNLERFIVEDLMEMERVGSSDNVNIVVQIDLGNNDYFSSPYAAWSDTRRYQVNYHPEDGLGSTRLDDPPLGELDMDDPETLREFLEWGLTNYPADHYMIALEGHAGGPARGLMEDRESTLGGSRTMATHEMGKAIRSAIDAKVGGPVDVISFDVCWMGMAEAAAEIMDHADYMVGSFDEIPGAGWPYDRCLPEIVNATGMPLSERLANVVSEYMDHYDPEGSNSYASLVVVDLPAFKASLFPVLHRWTGEVFYSAHSHRDVYSSLLTLVDKPRAKNDNDWDRYVDLYQLAQLMSMEEDLPERVRIYSSQLLATEHEVIVSSMGGSNHPDPSRLFGIYFPTNRNQQDRYSALVMSKATAWDEHAALVVEEMQISGRSVNWTSGNPGKVVLGITSETPARISKMEMQVILDGVSENHTIEAQGGSFLKEVDVSGAASIGYRYTVTGFYDNSVDLPPDGTMEAKIAQEEQPPVIWHSVPDMVRLSSEGGGLFFMIRDDTGVDTSGPDSLPRLEYRERDNGSWYSIPLVETGYDGFRGWISYRANPSGVPPGREIEYHVVARDVLGNQARYPSVGEAYSKMSEGKRFYLDAFRSHISDHDLLIDIFSDLGMTVSTGLEEELPDLSSYKGAIIIEPDQKLGTAQTEVLLEFHREGGELLLILDPNDPEQSSNVEYLLTGIGASLTKEGSVDGFFPSHPDSDLGDPLPSIAGSSTGSIVTGDKMVPVYYTSPPDVAMATGWYGKGKSVISHHCLLDDRVMGYSSNRQLAEMVISFLQENTLPEVVVDLQPGGVITPGQKLTIDLSSSEDRDGTIVSYSISYSDNTYSEGPDPIFERSFLTAGVYTALITVTDAEKGSSSASISVKVNRPPSIEHSISSSTVHAGETVVFDYKGSDPDGDEVMVLWDFGDGFKVSERTVTHPYQQRGEYTYTMFVRDANGIEVNRSGTVTVENSVPEAVMDRERITVNEGPANFTGATKVTLKVLEGDVVKVPGDLSSDNDRTDVLNFTWYMGDGTVLYGEFAVHAYTSSGMHEAELVVDDGHGGVANETLLISVANRDPVAHFTVEEKDGRMIFDASSSTDDPWDLEGLEYIWDLGDGTGERTDEPYLEHEYSFGGTYDVVLTVVDGDGGEDEYMVGVDVEGLTFTEVISISIVVLVLLGIAGAAAFIFLRRKLDREGRGLKDLLTGSPPLEEEGGFSRPVPVSEGSTTGRSFSGIEGSRGPGRP